MGVGKRKIGQIKDLFGILRKVCRLTSRKKDGIILDYYG